MTHSAEEPAPTAGWSAIYRILDANANRAGEALRVIEEACRFVRGDREQTDKVKQLRHELSQALDRLDLGARLTARDTDGDVGTELTAERESRRRDMSDVLLANFQRLEQSMRALEEYSKITSDSLGRAFEQMRYRCYGLEKSVVMSVLGDDRRGRLEQSAFYVLIDGRGSAGELQQTAAEVLQAGADIIQLRDKDLSDRELVERARALRDVVPPPALMIVNDRPDVALIAGADGVHVGQDELAIRDARQVLGPDKLVGAWTHNMQQARSAAEEADYIGCGPTFPSTTKSFDSFPGLDFLRQVAGTVQVPVFAIGGVTLANIRHVYDAGITRVALSGALWNAPDPSAEMRELVALRKVRWPATSVDLS